MGIFDIFKGGEKTGKGIPFDVKMHFTPVRLSAYKTEGVDLRIKIKNMEEEPILTSIVVEVPKALGVDQSGIAKAKEIRFGFLQKNEEKEVIVPIWGNVTTPPGIYPIKINIMAHYRSYAYIQNAVRTKAELRVV